MIRVEKLNKGFEDKQVLFDISVDYLPGKCNMIIGASGSGKTVLLKNLIGLLQPDSGEIYYDDQRLSQLNYQQRQALRQQIGIVFQGSALFDFTDVLGNVMFPMDFFTDWSKSEKIERARFLLDRVNVKDAETKYANELSGGMQKRVAIARALALNPRYLFCDEPNSGLDPVTSVVIDELIYSVTQEFNITTVVNTHDMNSILTIGDSIGYIHEGRMVWKGDKTSILHTDSEELRSFLSSNTLARTILSSRK